jgi:hypothetical protein
LRPRLVDEAFEIVEPVPEDRIHQCGLRFETPVQRSHAHPGSLGDIAHARRQTLTGEHGLGRLEDAHAIARSIGAQRALGHRLDHGQSLPLTHLSGMTHSVWV